MSDKRTAVKRPRWGASGVPEHHVVEVGPREIRSYGHHTGKDLARRDVYLDGEKIGYVEQIEVRNERPWGRSRIVTVLGYGLRWQPHAEGLRRGFGTHMRFSQMNEAVYRVVTHHLYPEDN